MIPRGGFGRASLALAALLALAACRRSEDDATRGSPSASSGAAKARPPAVLYLPDGGDSVLGGSEGPPRLPVGPRGGRCPADMVFAAGRFCVDRYEDVLVDARLGRSISPYFAPSRSDALRALELFREGVPAAAPRLPLLPGWEQNEPFVPRAESRAGAIPNGYVSGILAARACATAGKRLCTLAEWIDACRGEERRKFPYGERYEPGVCNVGREAHPADVLYGNASVHHLDPRLNLVAGAEGPLLRRTGESARCRSDWSGDAVFDMVGNLDEWVDEPSGAFVGGFFSRATVDGCDARITQHPQEYFDYSIGVRCCL